MNEPESNSNDETITEKEKITEKDEFAHLPPPSYPEYEDEESNDEDTTTIQEQNEEATTENKNEDEFAHLPPPSYPEYEDEESNNKEASSSKAETAEKVTENKKIDEFAHLPPPSYPEYEDEESNNKEASTNKADTEEQITKNKNIDEFAHLPPPSYPEYEDEEQNNKEFTPSKPDKEEEVTENKSENKFAHFPPPSPSYEHKEANNTENSNTENDIEAESSSESLEELASTMTVNTETDMSDFLYTMEESTGSIESSNQEEYNNEIDRNTEESKTSIEENEKLYINEENESPTNSLLEDISNSSEERKTTEPMASDTDKEKVSEKEESEETEEAERSTNLIEPASVNTEEIPENEPHTNVLNSETDVSDFLISLTSTESAETSESIVFDFEAENEGNTAENEMSINLYQTTSEKTPQEISENETILNNISAENTESTATTSHEEEVSNKVTLVENYSTTIKEGAVEEGEENGQNEETFTTSRNKSVSSDKEYDEEENEVTSHANTEIQIVTNEGEGTDKENLPAENGSSNKEYDEEQNYEVTFHENADITIAPNTEEENLFPKSESSDKEEVNNKVTLVENNYLSTTLKEGAVEEGEENGQNEETFTTSRNKSESSVKEYDEEENYEVTSHANTEIQIVTNEGEGTDKENLPAENGRSNKEYDEEQNYEVTFHENAEITNAPNEEEENLFPKSESSGKEEVNNKVTLVENNYLSTTIKEGAVEEGEKNGQNEEPFTTSMNKIENSNNEYDEEKNYEVTSHENTEIKNITNESEDTDKENLPPEYESSDKEYDEEQNYEITESESSNKQYDEEKNRHVTSHEGEDTNKENLSPENEGSDKEYNEEKNHKVTSHEKAKTSIVTHRVEDTNKETIPPDEATEELNEPNLTLTESNEEEGTENDNVEEPAGETTNTNEYTEVTQLNEKDHTKSELLPSSESENNAKHVKNEEEFTRFSIEEKYTTSDAKSYENGTFVSNSVNLQTEEGRTESISTNINKHWSTGKKEYNPAANVDIEEQQQDLQYLCNPCPKSLKTFKTEQLTSSTYEYETTKVDSFDESDFALLCDPCPHGQIRKSTNIEQESTESMLESTEIKVFSTEKTETETEIHVAKITSQLEHVAESSTESVNTIPTKSEPPINSMVVAQIQTKIGTSEYFAESDLTTPMLSNKYEYNQGDLNYLCDTCPGSKPNNKDQSTKKVTQSITKGMKKYDKEDQIYLCDPCPKPLKINNTMLTLSEYTERTDSLFEHIDVTLDNQEELQTLFEFAKETLWPQHMPTESNNASIKINEAHVTDYKQGITRKYIYDATEDIDQDYKEFPKVFSDYSNRKGETSIFGEENKLSNVFPTIRFTETDFKVQSTGLGDVENMPKSSQNIGEYETGEQQQSSTSTNITNVKDMNKTAESTTSKLETKEVFKAHSNSKMAQEESHITELSYKNSKEAGENTNKNEKNHLNNNVVSSRKFDELFEEKEGSTIAFQFTFNTSKENVVTKIASEEISPNGNVTQTLEQENTEIGISEGLEEFGKSYKNTNIYSSKILVHEQSESFESKVTEAKILKTSKEHVKGSKEYQYETKELPKGAETSEKIEKETTLNNPEEETFWSSETPENASGEIGRKEGHAFHSVEESTIVFVSFEKEEEILESTVATKEENNFDSENSEKPSPKEPNISSEINEEQNNTEELEESEPIENYQETIKTTESETTETLESFKVNEVTNETEMSEVNQTSEEPIETLPNESSLSEEAAEASEGSSPPHYEYEEIEADENAASTSEYSESEESVSQPQEYASSEAGTSEIIVGDTSEYSESEKPLTQPQESSSSESDESEIIATSTAQYSETEKALLQTQETASSQAEISEVITPSTSERSESEEPLSQPQESASYKAELTEIITASGSTEETSKIIELNSTISNPKERISSTEILESTSEKGKTKSKESYQNITNFIKNENISTETYAPHETENSQISTTVTVQTILATSKQHKEEFTTTAETITGSEKSNTNEETEDRFKTPSVSENSATTFIESSEPSIYKSRTEDNFGFSVTMTYNDILATQILQEETEISEGLEKTNVSDLSRLKTVTSSETNTEENDNLYTLTQENTFLKLKSTIKGEENEIPMSGAQEIGISSHSKSTETEVNEFTTELAKDMLDFKTTPCEYCVAKTSIHFSTEAESGLQTKMPKARTSTEDVYNTEEHVSHFLKSTMTENVFKDITDIFEEISKPQGVTYTSKTIEEQTDLTNSVHVTFSEKKTSTQLMPNISKNYSESTTPKMNNNQYSSEYSSTSLEIMQQKPKSSLSSEVTQEKPESHETSRKLSTESHTPSSIMEESTLGEHELEQIFEGHKPSVVFEMPTEIQENSKYHSETTVYKKGATREQHTENNVDIDEERTGPERTGQTTTEPLPPDGIPPFESDISTPCELCNFEKTTSNESVEKKTNDQVKTDAVETGLSEGTAQNEIEEKTLAEQTRENEVTENGVIPSEEEVPQTSPSEESELVDNEYSTEKLTSEEEGGGILEGTTAAEENTLESETSEEHSSEGPNISSEVNEEYNNTEELEESEPPESHTSEEEDGKILETTIAAEEENTFESEASKASSSEEPNISSEVNEEHNKTEELEESETPESHTSEEEDGKILETTIAAEEEYTFESEAFKEFSSEGPNISSEVNKEQTNTEELEKSEPPENHNSEEEGVEILESTIAAEAKNTFESETSKESSSEGPNVSSEVYEEHNTEELEESEPPASPTETPGSNTSEIIEATDKTEKSELTRVSGELTEITSNEHFISTEAASTSEETTSLHNEFEETKTEIFTSESSESEEPLSQPQEPASSEAEISESSTKEKSEINEVESTLSNPEERVSSTEISENVSGEDNENGASSEKTSHPEILSSEKSKIASEETSEIGTSSEETETSEISQETSTFSKSEEEIFLSSEKSETALEETSESGAATEKTETSEIIEEESTLAKPEEKLFSSGERFENTSEEAEKIVTSPEEVEASETNQAESTLSSPKEKLSESTEAEYSASKEPERARTSGEESVTDTVEYTEETTREESEIAIFQPSEKIAELPTSEKEQNLTPSEEYTETLEQQSKLTEITNDEENTLTELNEEKTEHYKQTLESLHDIIPPTTELRSKPLGFETTACEYCNTTIKENEKELGVSHQASSEETEEIVIKTKTRSTESQEEVEEHGEKSTEILHTPANIEVDNEENEEETEINIIVTTIEIERGPIGFQSTVCEFCSSEKPEHSSGSTLTEEAIETEEESADETTNTKIYTQISTEEEKEFTKEHTKKEEIHTTEEATEHSKAAQTETPKKEITTSTEEEQAEVNASKNTNMFNYTHGHLVTMSSEEISEEAEQEYKSTNEKEEEIKDNEGGRYQFKTTHLFNYTHGHMISMSTEESSEEAEQAYKSTNEKEGEIKDNEADRHQLKTTHLFNYTHGHIISMSTETSSEETNETEEDHKKEQSSVEGVSKKPMVIIIKNSKNEKLNESVLEQILSTSIPDVELHYVDLQQGENEGIVPVENNKPFKIDVPHEKCEKAEFEKGTDCFCDIHSYLDTLNDKGNKAEVVMSKKSYCESFVRLKDGLIMKSSLKPIKRKRRGLIYMNSLKQKGETLQFDSIDDAFGNNFKLKVSDTNLFYLPSETIRIPCLNQSMDKESNGIIWTFTPASSVKVELLAEKGQELVLHVATVKNAGNYTCATENEKDSPEKQHWRELEVITFPSYQITMNIFYKINDSCSLQIGDALYAYLPKIVNPILCSNENEICSVDVSRPRCLTREDDNYFNVTINVKMTSDFVLPLHSQCNINCKLRLYENMVYMVYRNSEILEHISVYSQLEQLSGIAFVPHISGKEGSPVHIKPPRIFVSCLSGFGLESQSQSVCVVCPPQTFSNDDEAFCKTCPGGQYQPEAGSKSCIQCNSPVDDKMCLRMLYTDTKLFKIYVGVAFGSFVLMIIVIIMWSSGPKNDTNAENRYYEGSLRHRAGIKRKDMDLEVGANEPLLRQSPQRRPPQLPPIDF